MQSLQQARAGVVVLFKESGAAIRKYKLWALLFLLLSFVIPTVSTEKESFIFFHLLVVFFWMKIIAAGNTPQAKRDIMKGFWGFFFNFIALALILVAVAMAAFGLLFGIVHLFTAPSSDAIKAALAIMPWGFSALVSFAFMARVILAFPAIAFGEKVLSLKSVWSQSRNYFWTLFWGILLIVLILPGLFILIAIVADILSTTWVLNAFISVVGVTSDLMFAGYVTYAYIAVTENGKIIQPADVPAAAGKTLVKACQGLAMAAIASFLLSYIAALAINANPSVSLASTLIVSGKDDYNTALQTAAEHGDAEAQCQLGEDYFSGSEGFANNQAEAVKWLQKSAGQGNICGLHNLGVAYQQGIGGLQQDDKKAVLLWRQAAEKGFASSQYNLGLMYHKGMGVDQDDTEAKKWLKKAADQGDAGAKDELDAISSDEAESGKSALPR